MIKDLCFYIFFFIIFIIKKRLCFDIILNILKNGQKEYELATIQPEEFVALDNDICDLKVIKNYKYYYK